MIKGKIQFALSTIPTHHIESLLTVLVYMEANLDKTLPISKLAEIARISPYYFHRLFHTYFSMPPRKYIKYIRLTKSAKLLRYANFSITEIAFAMGYEDASSFTKAFLRLSGKSPRAYRKETRHQLHMMHQSMLPHKIILQPEYRYKEEKTVFFRRKTGDYKVTVIEGIQECQQEFAHKKKRVLTCYGIALDDPLIISREQCRFDICVMAPSLIRYKGLWGQRKLPGGKYALFTHHGPLSELEDLFTKVFYHWHTRWKEKLRFSGAFCEYVDLPLNITIFPSTEVTAKYYVPLLEEKMSDSPIPSTEDYTVEFFKAPPASFLERLKNLVLFFWFLPKRVYNTCLLIRYQELKKPASKNVCPVRYLNPFFYLNYSTYIAAKSTMIKAILKHPRKDPEQGIFDDQDNALVFLPIFRDLYPEEVITPEDFLLTCSKENVRKYRQPILRFIGPQHIEGQNQGLQTVIEDTIQFYCSQCKEGGVNATEFSFTLAVAVVSRLFLGHLGPFDIYRKIATAVDSVNRSVMKRALKQPLSSEEKEEYKQSIQILRSAIDTSFHLEDRQSLGSFIQSLREEKHLTAIQIKLSLFAMYFAGSDTTSGLLNHLLWQLGKHPKMQEKIFQEMQSSQADLFDYANHSFTINQLISESIRLYTPTYVIGRVSACPFLCTVKDRKGNTLFQKRIAKNAKLLSMPTFAARDPQIFDNPDQFNPDRFKTPLKSYSWFPFGDGPHSCPGQWLARAEISLFIALLVEKYKFSSSPEKEFQQLGYISLKPSEVVILQLVSRNAVSKTKVEIP